jgi:hypothetical protein
VGDHNTLQPNAQWLSKLLVYFHLWPVCLYNIFPHYLINDTIKKKVTEYKVCSFYTVLVWHISHSQKNSPRYYHKCTYIGFHVKYLLLFSDLNLDSLKLSSHIFEKYSNIEFHENPFRASWVVACDRHDKANSHFSQFCELAFKSATHFNPTRPSSQPVDTWKS